MSSLNPIDAGAATRIATRRLRGRTLILLSCLPLSVSGLALADDEGFTYWGDYHLSASSSLILDSGIIALGGSFDAAINNANRFDLRNATLQFIGWPGAGPYNLEAMAEDIGFCDLTLPDRNLYSIKKLRIGPSSISVRLVDNHNNASGVGNEGVYVQQLVFEQGTTLDVRGLNLYYQTLTPLNAGQPGSGITISDSVGGGGIWALGTDSPVTPTGSHTNNNEICFGENTQLFATANPGLVVDWYTDDCGISPSNRPLGTFIGTGNPLTVSPTATSTYYAQSRNPSTGCISRICDAGVTVIVHANPLCTITADAVVCTGASELSATVQNAGSNTTYAWTVTGGTITSGQNTDTIHFVADDVGTIIIEVTVTKTWSNADGAVCDTTCQTTLITDRYVWRGPDGGSFLTPANWDLSIVPGSIPPGGDAIITNTAASNNTCVLDDPGGSHVMCNVKVRGTGAGKQIVQINKDSTLTSSVATRIDIGGEIALRDGTLAGGPVTNLSNTLSGHGHVTANVTNTGLIQSTPLKILEFNNTSFANQAGGVVRATIGSGIQVDAGTVTQAGQLEAQVNASIVYASPLLNSSPGLITLLGGGLSANGITNAAGAQFYGFGTIQSNVLNQGTITTIAGAQIVGNVTNSGTIIIQSGLLTITGTLSGSGTMIGGFGGRDGQGAGLRIDGDWIVPVGATLDAGSANVNISGDFDVAIDDSARFGMTGATLQMDGPAAGVQTLEAMATDVGPRASLSDGAVFPIGTLHIGPGATTVQLVDHHENAPGGGDEAVYVGHLILDPGTTLDLAGRRMYYATMTPSDPSSAEGGKVIDSVGGGGITRLLRRASGAQSPQSHNAIGG